MKQRNKWIPILCICIAVLALVTTVLLLLKNTDWSFARTVGENEKALRLQYVKTAEQWLGSNAHDGSHKAIIDLYNAHEPLAQGYTVKYTDKWCATFVSTVAIQCNLTDIIPTECGCQRQIGLFEALDCWEENDDYIPLPGDIIYYSEKGTQSQDNTGWSDHVGIVAGTRGNFIKVIEGNVAGVAAVRYIRIGDASIRGYALPDYAGKA